jgi:4-hydroxy-tetrahydrodipicolinate reductase
MSVTDNFVRRTIPLGAVPFPSWEIIDYAHADKVDAPSGTTLELAEELARIRGNHAEVPIERTHGFPEARGAAVSGTHVHSVRLPTYVIAFETIFGLPDAPPFGTTLEWGRCLTLEAHCWLCAK